ncbi:hypothetical protein BO78DRAFT_451642 [Aspergillus sclerotiicarbonarius CBS 121057]|uniref:Alcohol acetyltransferase n=1 Tax=Aspergillus sclerotiicarbonarius (strain CBS 121057 / IBT 28362) TaxID=1448318 RepID=A0A319FBQ1_ASPSB|nr:hypothetical protein BO78DRAFT_451642 [Aspergillus sclerotiicarbonarius CBS 121057]
MADIHRLETLRPLGKLEQAAAYCHHVGFFKNVGLSAHYKLTELSPAVSNLRGLIYAAIRAVVREHRILVAIPVNEGAASPHFASLPSIDLDPTVAFLQRSDPKPEAALGEDKELDAVLEYQHNIDFKSAHGTLPFWRLIILHSPGSRNEFTASFIYHHAIGDGVSGAGNIILVDKNTSVLPPLETLHPLPINPSAAPSSSMNPEEWTGGFIRTQCKSRWTSIYLSPNHSRHFIQECKEKNISVTSALTSMVATILFENLPSDVEAVTCIIPINLRPWLRLPRQIANGAIGSYFDVTRARLRRPARNLPDNAPANIWSGAAEVSTAINDYRGNVSPSGEPYTSVAIFNTISDVPAIFKGMVGKPRDAALEVTNVGVFSRATTSITEKACVWHVTKVLLSRSCAITGAAVTVSVATDEDGTMALGFSWQEGVVESSFVDNVRQGMRDYMQRNH